MYRRLALCLLVLCDGLSDESFWRVFLAKTDSISTRLLRVPHVVDTCTIGSVSAWSKSTWNMLVRIFENLVTYLCSQNSKLYRRI